MTADYELDMSADDKDVRPSDSLNKGGTSTQQLNLQRERSRKSIERRVSFPEEDRIVTQYFEPANPWHDGEYTGKPSIFIYHLYYLGLAGPRDLPRASLVPGGKL